MTKALLLVDIQNDFLPGGLFAVETGNEIIPIANEVVKLPFDVIVGTKDWHPADHGSFATNHPEKKPGDHIMLAGVDQTLWPIHCVQDTPGAEYSPLLHSEKIQKIFFKGTDKNIDSYSTFFDNKLNKSTGMADYLKSKKVKEVYILGLTTEYCVKYSAFDAMALGFTTYVIADGCRGIEVKAGDTEAAWQAMKSVGVKVIDSKDLLK